MSVRTRCESCLPSSTCQAVTSASGNEECTRLAEANGRGYFLLCANLALAISAVDLCVEDLAAGCGGDNDAASELTQLENNANFIDTETCASALDACLADIYGPPGGQFPGPGPDGGIAPLSEEDVLRWVGSEYGVPYSTLESVEPDKPCGE